MLPKDIDKDKFDEVLDVIKTVPHAGLEQAVRDTAGLTNVTPGIVKEIRRCLMQVCRNETRRLERNDLIKRPNKCQECNRSVKLQCHHEDYGDPRQVQFLCKPCHDKHRHLVRVKSVIPPMRRKAWKAFARRFDLDWVDTSYERPTTREQNKKRNYDHPLLQSPQTFDGLPNESDDD